MTNLRRVSGATLLMALIIAPTAKAGAQVGDIQAFYFAKNTKVTSIWPDYALGKLDDVVFVFENTSGADITNAVFAIGGSAPSDMFNIGTIAANSHLFLAPGLSNDGAAGHTFFADTGSITDQSDVGPNDNSVAFQFTGMENGKPVSSGTFRAGDSVKPSGDGLYTSVPMVNFLGGPGNNDSPSHDYYDPGTVAHLNYTPEPGSLAFVGSLALMWGIRARASKYRRGLK